MEKPRYDVFLSHATPDKPAVEELARRLKAQKLEPWLDKWNLIPGEPWQEAIEQALEDCATCAVCLGPSGTGPWQNEEMRTAIDRRVSDRSRTFRVIPVLLPHSERGEPSRLPAFLRTTTWVEFRETLDDENALHRLASGIRGLPPGPDPGEAVAEGAQPYRGLQVFDVADAPFFFGREALTEWLLDKLRTDRTGNRFLAIVGPSGSGKSSLARAGLAAALKQGKIPGSDAWPAVICKPGAQPLESLAVALAGAARLGDSPSAVLNLIRDLGTSPSLLHLTTRLSLRDAPADRRLVVLVDQFEEVFTLCPDEAQRQAIIANLLYAATAADGQTVVVLTLRADFYGRCAAYPDLATAVSDRQSLVGPMTRDELRSAIERPAYLAGCELEGGLTDLLLNEVESQPGSLPLLEHALLQIWQRREGGRRLTIDAYREVGGVAGALEKHAEEVYSGFTEEEKEACRQIFLRLVQVDEQGRATKRRLGLEELPGEGVVSRLTNARLLTTTDQEQRPTVELAHEALLANWERLKKWIGEDRDALRTRRRLDEVVAEWIGKDRDSSFLLEGGRLAQTEEWATNHPGELGSEAKDLIAASIAARDQERQRELDQAKALEEEQRRRADAEHQRAEEQGQARRRQKKWTLISLAATVLALIAASYSGVLWWLGGQRQKIDLAGHLAERSRHVLESDPMLSLLLSIKAVRLAEGGGQPHLPSAEGVLRSALFEAKGVPLLTGRVRAASLSADSKWMAIAGMDGIISVWALEPGEGPVKVASVPVDRTSIQVLHIAVSYGGQWVLVADQNGDSHLFNMSDFKRPESSDLDGEDWLSGKDPFSPNGHRLLTRSKDFRWRLRSLAQPHQQFKYLAIHPGALAFSPDGQWLAVAEPGSFGIWNLETLEHNPRFTQISRGIDADNATIAFSSDSQWLIAGEDVSGGGEDLKQHLAQAWRIKPMLEASVPVYLDRCAWSTPDSPKLLDPFLVSHIPSLAKCLALAAGRDQITGSLPEIDESDDRIAATAFAPWKNKIIAGSQKGKLWVADLAHHGMLQTYGDFRAGPVHLLAAQGRWLIAQNRDDAPRVFGEDILTSDNKFLSRFDSRAVSPNGLQLRFDHENETLLLSGPHGSWPLKYKEGGTSLWRFSPDGRWLATISRDRKPLAWHLDAQGKPSSLTTFSSRYSHSSRVTALTLSAGGRWLVSGDETGAVRLWDLQSPGTDPEALVNHMGPVNALAFNLDDHLLATAGDDGIVRLSEIADGQAPRVLPSPPANPGERVTALAFLSDDRLAIGSSGSNRILLWQPSGGVLLESADLGTRELVSSPDGVNLASLTGSGNIQIWYSTDHNNLPLASVNINGIPLNEIRFTSDGTGLEGNDFGEIFRVELRIDKLLESACKAAGRNLTEREWRENIPAEPYQEHEPCPGFPKAYD